MKGKEQMTGMRCCQNRFSRVRKTACWSRLLRNGNLFRRQQLPFQNGCSSDKSNEYGCLDPFGVGVGLPKDRSQDNSVDSGQNCIAR